MLIAPIEAVPDRAGFGQDHLVADSCRKRSAAVLVSSTLQFLKTSPNLLRRTGRARRRRAAARTVSTSAIGVRDVETKASLFAPNDQCDQRRHGTIGSMASSIAPPRSDEMRAIEFAGRQSCLDSRMSCSSQAWRSLLTRTMPCTHRLHQSCKPATWSPRSRSRRRPRHTRHIRPVGDAFAARRAD
jgi:hypothetical protein